MQSTRNRRAVARGLSSSVSTPGRFVSNPFSSRPHSAAKMPPAWARQNRNARHDEVGGGHTRFVGVAEEVVQVERRQPGVAAHAGMHEHERSEFVQPFPQRRIAGVGIHDAGMAAGRDRHAFEGIAILVHQRQQQAGMFERQVVQRAQSPVAGLCDGQQFFIQVVDPATRAGRIQRLPVDRGRNGDQRAPDAAQVHPFDELVWLEQARDIEALAIQHQNPLVLQPSDLVEAGQPCGMDGHQMSMDVQVYHEARVSREAASSSRARATHSSSISTPGMPRPHMVVVRAG